MPTLHGAWVTQILKAGHVKSKGAQARVLPQDFGVVLGCGSLGHSDSSIWGIQPRIYASGPISAEGLGFSLGLRTLCLVCKV